MERMSPEEKTRHRSAIRNAKVVASDLKLYHGELVEKAVANNAIVRLIGPFIKDSWRMYKQRVPSDIVKSTNYFKEALNEFVCGGKKIF